MVLCPQMFHEAIITFRHKRYVDGYACICILMQVSLFIALYFIDERALQASEALNAASGGKSPSVASAGSKEKEKDPNGMSILF